MTDKTATEELKKSANKADLTSSPALNNDALTDDDSTGDHHMPNGNRLD